MRLDPVDFLYKVSGKFLHEVVPVALASVVGMLLVNHYTRGGASPAIVVQPPAPPAAADAVLHALEDEHRLIVDCLKRDADAKRAADQAGLAESPPLSPMKERPKVRSASAEKRPPLPPQRPTLESEKPAREPMQLGPDLANLPHPAAPGYPQAIPAVVMARSTEVAGAVRDWVVSAALAAAPSPAAMVPAAPPSPAAAAPPAVLLRER
jgi:hypothetical protein